MELIPIEYVNERDGSRNNLFSVTAYVDPEHSIARSFLVASLATLRVSPTRGGHHNMLRRTATPTPGARMAHRSALGSRRAATDLDYLLDEYLARDGRSLNRIAHAALIDVGYLSRLR